MLNLIRIIYSIYMVNKYTDYNINIINDVLNNHTTYWLSDIQICHWINYLKEIGICNNWTKSQMFREVKYHNILYKHNLFRSHTNYTDFEENQTFKTYIKRFLGNILF